MRSPFPIPHLAAALACLLGVGGLWSWRDQLLATERDLAEQLQGAEAKWKIRASQQEEADRARASLEIYSGLEAWLAADQKVPKWANLLQVLSTQHGPETQLTHLEASTSADTPEMCELRLSGTSDGEPQPRASADQFRRSLQAALEKLCTPGSVTVDFASLEDLPATDPKKQPRCAFTVTAKFRPASGAPRPVPAAM